MFYVFYVKSKIDISNLSTIMFKRDHNHTITYTDNCKIGSFPNRVSSNEIVTFQMKVIEINSQDIN